jgi:prepilin-type processing-associated H-X9-DG protein
MSNKKTTRTELAFTLVELLVVVGIIAVLIAILMPVLAKARQQAQSVHCASNLRSIGHALTMYTQQYAYYPGLTVGDRSGSNPIDAAAWPARLRQFLAGGKEVFQCPSRDEDCRWSDSGPLPLIQATIGSRFVVVGYDVGEPLVHGGARFSYGYNGWGMAATMPGSIMDGSHKGLGADLSIGDHRNVRELPASRVKVPEDMIAVTDSNADRVLDYGVMADARNTITQPGRVHSRGANVLFCDGHVTWFPLEDLLVSNRLDPAQATKVRRWNNDHGLGDDWGAQ